MTEHFSENTYNNNAGAGRKVNFFTLEHAVEMLLFSKFEEMLRSYQKALKVLKNAFSHLCQMSAGAAA